jgi:hypothetical protein
MRLVGNVTRMGRRDTYRVLVGNSERNSALERPFHRWVYIIKMDLGEIVCRGMGWINLAEHKDK